MFGRTHTPSARAEQYQAGMAFYRAGQHAQAAVALEPLADGRDLLSRLARYYHAMAHRAMGIQYLVAGAHAEAEQHLRVAVQGVGPQAELANYLASVYAKLGRHEECLRQSDSLVGTLADGREARCRLALAQWRAGRRSPAYATLQEAIRRFGDDARLRTQLGLFHAAEENFAAAHEHLELASRLDADNPQPHRYLGMVSGAMKRPLEAAYAFQRACELDPADMASAWQMATAAKAARQAGQCITLRLPEALPADGGSQVRQLALFVTREPEFLDAFLALPPSDVDHELFTVLLGVVQLALAEHPAYADLRYHCSRIHQRLGHAAEAAREAEIALQINPRYVAALVQCGRLLAAAGDSHAAGERLEQAISLGADWADVHCLAAETATAAGQSDVARQHLERALQLNSNFTKARDAMALLAA